MRNESIASEALRLGSKYFPVWECFLEFTDIPQAHADLCGNSPEAIRFLLKNKMIQKKGPFTKKGQLYIINKKSWIAKTWLDFFNSALRNYPTRKLR